MSRVEEGLNTGYKKCPLTQGANIITGILLAAGYASRFGSQKLLARLADGRRLVEASMSPLSAACSGNVIVVTRRDPDLIRLLETCDCRIVINDQAAQGIGTSIAVAVASASDASGWVIALGDMPFVRRETVIEIVAALRGGAYIALPTMDGKRGHPVGFSARYRYRLQALTGDTGAREIINADANFVEAVSVADPGIFLDIDTRADINR